MCLMRVLHLQLNSQQELDPSTKYLPERGYGNIKYQWQTPLGDASTRLHPFQAKDVQTLSSKAVQGLQGHFAVGIRCVLPHLMTLRTSQPLTEGGH